MRISIIHPSRSRPQQAAATAKKWLSSAKDLDSIQYILSIDLDDASQKDYQSLFTLDVLKESKYAPRHMVCERNNNQSAIQAINQAATVASGDLLIVVSDDFDCPYHWDEALRTALAGKSDYIVKTDDGLQPWIITLPIMDRVYYERFGYVYNPIYRHMWSDTEMTAVGHMLDKIIRLPITFPHNHYTTGRTPKDEVNVKADSSMAGGRQIFMERLKYNFGIENPVKPLPNYQW